MTGIDRLRGIPVIPASPDLRRAWRWRRDQLIAAGLDEVSAYRLATSADVDIHEVLSSSDGDAAQAEDQRRG
jgi:hypothetical protein